jgi:23S rRNA pseudouridine955/2504/2580 synthase
VTFVKKIDIHEEQAGQRLDKFLRRYLPGAGSGFLYKMLRKKNIVLNGGKAAGNELLRSGDVIRIYFSDDTLKAFGAEKMADSASLQFPKLDPSWILFEDDHLIAIDKPAGVLSQKSRPEDVSLVEYLKGYLADSGNGLFSAGVANRLDRNTSGIVLAGKDNASARELSYAISTRTIRKFYLAACAGQIDRPAKIEGFLVKDSNTNMARILPKGSAPENAARIETAYRPLLILGYPERITLLEVELITGKTHQIRAHLASEGHPLIGDPRYGNPRLNRFFRQNFQLNRQFLHAARMEFPELGGILEQESGLVIRSPLPGSLETVLAGGTVRKCFDREWEVYGK